jgi:hypothetical protein
MFCENIKGKRLNSKPDTIVVINGLWMTTLSWEHWVKYYTDKGYRVIAKSWPGMDVPIDELRDDPAPSATLGLTDIYAAQPSNRLYRRRGAGLFTACHTSKAPETNGR